MRARRELTWVHLVGHRGLFLLGTKTLEVEFCLLGAGGGVLQEEVRLGAQGSTYRLLA